MGTSLATDQKILSLFPESGMRLFSSGKLLDARYGLDVSMHIFLHVLPVLSLEEASNCVYYYK